MLVFLLVLGLVYSDESFINFIRKYNKNYDNEELSYRLGVFQQNLKIIHQLNEQQPEAVYAVGEFADLTTEEFNEYYTGWVPSDLEYEELTLNGTVSADDIDWRSKNAITPIKNQGRCGSCWAFSATESIESEAFLSGSYSLEKLSCQQITSCDKQSNGCNGGDPGTGFDYIAQCGGIETESDYPYTSGGGQTGSCKFVSSKAKIKIAGKKKLSKGEDNVLTGLAQRPLSICHQTGGWQHYSGGIMTSCSSGGGHCTQMVGYGSSEDYWIVKNSWGSSWGNSGYLYLKKGSNLCGIANYASYPTV